MRLGMRPLPGGVFPHHAQREEMKASDVILACTLEVTSQAAARESRRLGQ